MFCPNGIPLKTNHSLHNLEWIPISRSQRCIVQLKSDSETDDAHVRVPAHGKDQVHLDFVNLLKEETISAQSPQLRSTDGDSTKSAI